jgi:hypothetical protein
MGWGEDETGWYRRGFVDLILDNLIAAGKAKSMIVVMDNLNTVKPGESAAIFGARGLVPPPPPAPPAPAAPLGRTGGGAWWTTSHSRSTEGPGTKTFSEALTSAALGTCISNQQPRRTNG